MDFFDESVQVTPPTGHLQPLPVTLGPNRQNNDVRLLLVSGSGVSGNATLEMVMTPDPPSSFTQAYALNPGKETHGVYYRRLVDGDPDDVSVAWAKPSGWQHFMVALLTARGVDPSSSPTAGWLKLSAVQGDTTATAASVSVPGAGVMLLMAGTVPSPWTNSSPAWAVSLGVPTGWTNIAATDKSGANFFPYGTDSSLIVVGKSFTGSGSTGSIVFPTSPGTPAFNGLYVFLPTPPNVTAAISPA